MKSKLLLTCTILFFCSSFLCGQNQSSKVANSVETNNGCIRHPWQGKRVGYLGDSITDPNCYGDKIKKYWDFLQEWLGITPYVYGISGRQWNDVPRQAEKLKQEHGGEVDAILGIFRAFCLFFLFRVGSEMTALFLTERNPKVFPLHSLGFLSETVRS